MGNRRRWTGAGSAEVALPARGPHRFAMCSRSAQGSPGSGAGTHPRSPGSEPFARRIPGLDHGLFRPWPRLPPHHLPRIRRRCRCRYPGATPRGPGGSWPARGPDRVRSASVSRAPRRRGDREAGRPVRQAVRAAAASLTAVTLVSGCGLVGGLKTIQADVPNQMTVTSQAFNSHQFPPSYTCHGRGQQPVAALVRRPAGHEISRPSGRRRLGTDPALYLLDRVRYRIADHRDPERAGSPGCAAGRQQQRNRSI